MVVISLMADLPEEHENWFQAPEFKNGPITRACIIAVYIMVMILIYKDQDKLINFRRGNDILNSAKMKYYLYNFSQVLFTAYVLSHETMDPTVARQFPYPEQDKERQAKA